jgi:DNA-binding CsgD family transcriptional regulator
VDSHVRNIMAKLEVGTRAQIAAWAVQHGLGGPR